jgi:hypothetical protein
MLEILDSIGQVWREIAHVSELTGLSIGVLCVLAAVVWFDPDARKFAIRLGLFVIVGYVLAMASYGLGARDVRAEWNVANARAAADAKQRDTSAAANAGADAANQDAALQAQRAKDQEVVNGLRNADKACHPIVVDQLR